MKNLASFLTGTLLLLTATLANAAVWRVNNQGYSAHFTDLQAAIDDINVSPGDTMHVEPSPMTYGEITLNKRLTLIGPGYFLNENNNPPLQDNPTTAQLHRLILPSVASGSKVTGLVIANHTFPWIYINTSNVHIDRCRVTGGVSFQNASPAQLDDILITRSYFSQGTDLPTFPGPVNGLTITNNFFGNTLALAATHQGVVAHNVLNGASVHGMEFYNNIVRVGNMTQNNNSNINVHHNIFHNDPGAWASGNGNHPNVTMNTVFGTTGSTDGNWKPIPQCQNCPNGAGNTQIGMYGGATPYLLSGIPAIPAIYDLWTPATVIQGSTVPVTIGTRSND